jgi:hypothetical protein
MFFEIDGSSEQDNLDVESLEASANEGKAGGASLGGRDRRRSSPTTHRKRPRRAPAPSRLAAGARYACLSTLAVALTVACPGQTSLWRGARPGADDPNGDDSDGQQRLHPQWKELGSILIWYALTLVLFLVVVATDPGHLTRDIMDRVELDERRAPSCPVDPAAEEQSRKLAAGKAEGSGEEDPDDDEGSPLFGPSSRSREAGGGDADDGSGSEGNRLRSSLTLRRTHRPNRRPYCRACRLDPPLRSHHCKKCNICVATFDHHCDLMGGCVGERNRGIFVLFLLAQAAGLAMCLRAVLTSKLGFSTLLFERVGRAGHLQHHLPRWEAVWVVVAEMYLVPLVFAAVLMAGAHVGLVAANVTTFECARHRHLEYLPNLSTSADDHGLSVAAPFSQGVPSNLALAFRQALDGLVLVLVLHRRRREPPWTPVLWQVPAPAGVHKAGDDDGASPDWWNHPWRNKYWSCC